MLANEINPCKSAPSGHAELCVRLDRKALNDANMDQSGKCVSFRNTLRPVGHWRHLAYIHYTYIYLYPYCRYIYLQRWEIEEYKITENIIILWYWLWGMVFFGNKSTGKFIHWIVFNQTIFNFNIAVKCKISWAFLNKTRKPQLMRGILWMTWQLVDE